MWAPVAGDTLTRVVGLRRVVRTPYIFLAGAAWIVWIAVLCGLGTALPAWLGWVAFVAAAGYGAAIAVFSAGWLSARMSFARDRFEAYSWPNRTVIPRDRIDRFISEARTDPRLARALWITSGWGPRLYYIVAVLKDGSRTPVMSSFAPRRLSAAQRDQLNEWLEDGDGVPSSPR